MATELAIYRDGDRYIVGRPEWQGRGVSTTYGVGEAATRRQAAEMVERYGRMTPEELEPMKRHFDTWDRFEDACDAGRYGAAW